MRRIATLIVIAASVTFAAGCGGDDSNKAVAQYLGPGYEVKGCHDAHYSQGKLELWKCVVNGPGDGTDWPEWNIAVRDHKIVDASPA